MLSVTWSGVLSVILDPCVGLTGLDPASRRWTGRTMRGHMVNSFHATVQLLAVNSIYLCRGICPCPNCILSLSVHFIYMYPSSYVGITVCRYFV